MAISTDRGFGSKPAWIATLIAIWALGGFAFDLALGAVGVEVVPAWILVSWTFLTLGFTKGIYGPFRGASEQAEAPGPRLSAPSASSGSPSNSYPATQVTWATLALKAGVHPKIVQERLGHSSIAITLDIYSHVTPAQESDAAARVAGLIFGSA